MRWLKSPGIRSTSPGQIVLPPLRLRGCVTPKFANEVPGVRAIIDLIGPLVGGGLGVIAFDLVEIAVGQTVLVKETTIGLLDRQVQSLEVAAVLIVAMLVCRSRQCENGRSWY